MMARLFLLSIVAGSLSCVVLARSALADPAAPSALACLARHSGAVVERLADGSYGLRTRDGAWLPWDDGKAKNWDERIDAPDLEDTLFAPYRRGPPVPITREDDEPGRVRHTGWFDAAYGRKGRSLPLVNVRVGGRVLRVHERVGPALTRVAKVLERLAKADPEVAKAIARPAGGFADRVIAGTTRPSAHSWGLAIDLDSRVSDYWRWARKGTPAWVNRMPTAVVDAFEAEGFVWGGRWFHYDTMHFEYRPELLDPACAPPR